MNFSNYQNMQSMTAVPQKFEIFGVRREVSEFLTVTVIPLEAHLNPYPLVVEVFPEYEKNLK